MVICFVSLNIRHASVPHECSKNKLCSPMQKIKGTRKTKRTTKITTHRQDAEEEKKRRKNKRGGVGVWWGGEASHSGVQLDSTPTGGGPHHPSKNLPPCTHHNLWTKHAVVYRGRVQTVPGPNHWWWWVGFLHSNVSSLLSPSPMSLVKGQHTILQYVTINSSLFSLLRFCKTFLSLKNKQEQQQQEGY